MVATYGCQRGKWGGRLVREFGMDKYTLLYLFTMTKNKD